MKSPLFGGKLLLNSGNPGVPERRSKVQFAHLGQGGGQLHCLIGPGAENRLPASRHKGDQRIFRKNGGFPKAICQFSGKKGNACPILPVFQRKNQPSAGRLGPVRENRPVKNRGGRPFGTADTAAVGFMTGWAERIFFSLIARKAFFTERRLLPSDRFFTAPACRRKKQLQKIFSESHTGFSLYTDFLISEHGSLSANTGTAPKKAEKKAHFRSSRSVLMKSSASASLRRGR